MASGSNQDAQSCYRILELFSGIGGMHYAAIQWSESAPARAVKVLEAFDVSSLANSVYQFNFTKAPSCKSIEHLDASYLDALGADTWLMSPPCQPYTSMGLQRDDEDPRARALLHLCDLLPKMKNPPSYILLENVRNFEVSRSHKRWKESLQAASFVTHEFLLTPTQLGVPNERLRSVQTRSRPTKGKLRSIFAGVEGVRPADEVVDLDDAEPDPAAAGADSSEPHMRIDGDDASGDPASCRTTPQYVDLNRKRAPRYKHCRKVGEYLDPPGPDTDAFLVADRELAKWKGYVLDIVTPDSRRCSCFTKSYSKYVRGTGSLVSTHFYDEQGRCLLDVDEPWQLHNMDLMRQLKLRYFSPAEVGRLMGFPRSLAYPPGYSRVMCYKLLGNSLHVGVVAALLQHLWSPDPCPAPAAPPEEASVSGAPEAERAAAPPADTCQ